GATTVEIPPAHNVQLERRVRRQRACRRAGGSTRGRGSRARRARGAARGLPATGDRGGAREPALRSLAEAAPARAELLRHPVEQAERELRKQLLDEEQLAVD